MSPQTISIFCKQLADIMNAQIIIYEGLEMLMSDWEEEELNGEMVSTINEIVNYLKMGRQLDYALQKTKKFPEYMVNMITIGIRTNKLQEVTEHLAEHYERVYRLQISIRNCIYYPVMLINMMFIVLVILMIKVLPIFEESLKKLKVTESTMFLFKTGRLMMEDTLGLLVIILILFVTIYLLKRLNLGKKILEHTKFSQLIATAEVASAFSLMVKSKLSMEEAFRLANDLIENQEVRKRIQKTVDLLAQNKSLSEALKESKVFSKLEVKKIEIAMKLECLDETVGNMARSYEERVNQMLEKKVVYLEKGTVFLVSILIGDILISVLLPLISVLSTLE